MNSKDMILRMMMQTGRTDALDLRTRASKMDGSAIIAEEAKIPAFDPSKDYSAWAIGAPVSDAVDGERQVFRLLQPHNASHYPQRPAELAALWSVTHTKDPSKAKAWLAPNGTSGLYAKDEVCIESGAVYRSKVENNAFSPIAYPRNWEVVL